MTEKSACPNEVTECELPLKAECSFKGCEPLDMHDESFDDVIHEYEGKALRDDLYTVKCESEQGSEFLIPTLGSELLAKDKQEFENSFKTVIFEGKDIEVNYTPHLKLICTHNRTWEFEDPKIR